MIKGNIGKNEHINGDNLNNSINNSCGQCQLRVKNELAVPTEQLQYVNSALYGSSTLVKSVVITLNISEQGSIKISQLIQT